MIKPLKVKMTSPKALLRAWNLRPKKKWGQHFLIDPSTADMIARHSQVSQTDTVIEIGAGLGALTIPVARMAKRVYAVEKDSRLIQLLKPELLAHKLTKRLGVARRNAILPFLRPDGKSQVTIEYIDLKPSRVDSVVVSAQHNPDVSIEDLRNGII